MRRVINTIHASAVVILAGSAVACGSSSAGDSTSTDAAQASGGTDRPTIVVTTNILGDVVAAAIGDAADVEVIMPLGSDPHDFAPSARQAESMENADLLVINGAGFEDGMLDIIANVSDSGTETFTFADHVELLQFDGHQDSDDEHSDDEGSDDEHSDGGADDPHLWTDPSRIATALTALEPVVAGLAGVDADMVATSVAAYLAELDDLESTMTATLEPIPDDRRVLVTNHEVFGYFADRFDFEVVGAIIPSVTTNAEPSAADIEELAMLIEAEGIPAIFGETTQSLTLANVLADEIGTDVRVVELFSESLGDEGSGAETYIDLMSTNAELIAQALT